MSTPCVEEYTYCFEMRTQTPLSRFVLTVLIIANKFDIYNFSFRSRSRQEPGQVKKEKCQKLFHATLLTDDKGLGDIYISDQVTISSEIHTLKTLQ